MSLENCGLAEKDISFKSFQNGCGIQQLELSRLVRTPLQENQRLRLAGDSRASREPTLDINLQIPFMVASQLGLEAIEFREKLRCFHLQTQEPGPTPQAQFVIGRSDPQVDDIVAQNLHA